MNLIVIVTIVTNKINVKNRITANPIAPQRNATLTLKNANRNAAQKNVEQKNAK
jgi:hypothetical protein